jgi:hypothetical protein
MGLKYNELSQLLGREQTEALIEEDPRLSGTEIVLFGKIAACFMEAHTLAHGIHKMVEFVKYAELNGMTLGNADPGATEISVIQEGGRWKKRAFRDCSTDELAETVLALKLQRGIPVEDDLFDFED